METPYGFGQNITSKERFCPAKVKIRCVFVCDVLKFKYRIINLSAHVSGNVSTEIKLNTN